MIRYYQLRDWSNEIGLSRRTVGWCGDRSPLCAQEIRLSGVIVDGADHEEEPQPSLRKTVLMSKVGRHLYELEEFEGANEEVAIYLPQEI